MVAKHIQQPSHAGAYFAKHHTKRHSSVYYEKKPGGTAEADTPELIEDSLNQPAAKRRKRKARGGKKNRRRLEDADMGGDGEEFTEELHGMENLRISNDMELED